MMLLLWACRVTPTPEEAGPVLPFPTVSAEPENSEPSDPSEETGDNLTVHFIDVGQGDATLLVCGEDAMLIDGGNNTKGTALQKYLAEQSITTLTYVVATHPDADHIGGLDVIVYKFDCENIWMPELTSDTASYEELQNALWEKNYTAVQPKVGETFTLGSACVTVLSPEGTHDNSNDYSIALLVTHGKNRFLFTGDLSAKAEEKLVSDGLIPDVDVYKAGHHGSSHSNSGALLDAAKPEYAVVSCGLYNKHGHPHAEVTEALAERDILLYRTDLQGTVVAVSDAETIVFQQAPTMDYASGRELKTRQEDALNRGIGDGNGITYVLNNNSMRFHLPDCPAVTDMAQDNRQDTDVDRDTLTELGYKPCGWCEP